MAYGRRSHSAGPTKKTPTVGKKRPSSQPRSSADETPKSIPEKRRRTGSTVSQGAPRRKSRKQVYSVALTEIHRLQRSTKPLIPRLPFYRLVKEISHDQMSEVQFYTVEAIECLREATEIFLVGYLEDSYRCTIHGNRVTLMEKDLILCADIRARYEPNVFTSRPGGRIAY